LNGLGIADIVIGLERFRPESPEFGCWLSVLFISHNHILLDQHRHASDIFAGCFRAGLELGLVLLPGSWIRDEPIPILTCAPHRVRPIRGHQKWDRLWGRIEEAGIHGIELPFVTDLASFPQLTDDLGSLDEAL